jgi:hypothetical protein
MGQYRYKKAVPATGHLPYRTGMMLTIISGAINSQSQAHHEVVKPAARMDVQQIVDCVHHISNIRVLQ